jgi:hypothetical protein
MSTRTKSRVTALLIEKGIKTKGTHYKRFSPKNSATISTILFHHLIVENHLIRFLEASSPNFLDWDNGELRFVQMVKLISTEKGPFYNSGIIEGLYRLNSLRNKFAHQLDAHLTLADVQPLRQIRIEDESRKLPGTPSPIQIIDFFCKTVCAWIAGYCCATAQSHSLPVTFPKRRNTKRQDKSSSSKGA